MDKTRHTTGEKSDGDRGEEKHPGRDSAKRQRAAGEHKTKRGATLVKKREYVNVRYRASETKKTLKKS